MSLLNPLLVERVRAAVLMELPLEPLLDRDFVPKDKPGALKDVWVFEKTDHPLHRCTAITGHDCQSGPYYCGEPATVVGRIRGGNDVLFCPKHFRATRKDMGPQVAPADMP